MLKYALLGFLSYSSLTGYELKQRMDSSTNNFWNANLSQIYTSLKSLEEDGWVKSKIQAQDDKPDKRIYTLTDEGLNSLKAWLEEPITDPEQRKSTFLLKLFFSAKVDKETSLAQLRVSKNLHQREKERYKSEAQTSIKDIVATYPSMKKEAIFWEATRRFGELYEEMYVHWLSETIELIENKMK